MYNLLGVTSDIHLSRNYVARRIHQRHKGLEMKPLLFKKWVVVSS